MDTITVLVGTHRSLLSGVFQDDRRPVVFEAERLGEYTAFGSDQDYLTDTRGVTQTLYRSADGHLVVHRCCWSQWAGEDNIESLHLVTEADLGPLGDYAGLGAACGFGQPLTLEEALHFQS